MRRKAQREAEDSESLTGGNVESSGHKGIGYLGMLGNNTDSWKYS